MTSEPHNIHDMEVLLCIWWDEKVVPYYTLLQPGETVDDKRYGIRLSREIDDLRSY